MNISSNNHFTISQQLENKNNDNYSSDMGLSLDQNSTSYITVERNLLTTHPLSGVVLSDDVGGKEGVSKKNGTKNKQNKMVGGLQPPTTKNRKDKPENKKNRLK